MPRANWKQSRKRKKILKLAKGSRGKIKLYRSAKEWSSVVILLILDKLKSVISQSGSYHRRCGATDGLTIAVYAWLNSPYRLDRKVLADLVPHPDAFRKWPCRPKISGSETAKASA